MKTAKIACVLLILVIIIPLSVPAQDNAFAVSGCILQKTGYLGLRADISDPASRDWFSETSVTLRLGQTDGTTRYRTVFRALYDMPGNTWTVSIPEAWFEWEPVPFLDLRAGRAPFAYGSCIAFSPANSLSAPDPFDTRVNDRGLNGLFVEIAPLSAVSAETSAVALTLHGAFLLPRQSAAITDPDIGEGSAHGRVSVLLPETGFLGQTEFGLSGDVRRIGRTAPEGEIPRATGAWLSMDIAGFVFGAEGTIRTPGYGALSIPDGTTPAACDKPETGFAVSLNRRFSDVFAIVEVSCEPEPAHWKGFAKLACTRGDAEFSLMGLFDFETESTRTSLETAWNAGDSLTFRVWSAVNYLPDRWSPALPYTWAAGIALEAFY